MTAKPNRLFFFQYAFIFLLSISVCFSVSVGQAAQANVYIADIIGRYLPKVVLHMDPGGYDRQAIISANDKNVDGVLYVEFQEARGYYGFSALVCDEENAKKYEMRDKADCFRKEIDVKSDTLRFNYKSHKSYYLFIVNRSKPLSMKRDITVTPYIYSKLTPEVRGELTTEIEKIDAQLNRFFSVGPLNYAVIPCRKKFIPSSIENKTLTICSELILQPNSLPQKNLLMGGIFYAIPEILEAKWEVSEIKTLSDHIEFVSMMIMLFSKDKVPYLQFMDLIETNPDVHTILVQFPAHKADKTRRDYINILIDINNTPFEKIDRWLNIAYEHMNNPGLEVIRDAKYRHYGFLRDIARVILKRRYEQELEANKVEPEKEKNIISDFW